MEKQANELGQELIDLRQSAVPGLRADDLSTQNYTFVLEKLECPSPVAPTHGWWAGHQKKV